MQAGGTQNVRRVFQLPLIVQFAVCRGVIAVVVAGRAALILILDNRSYESATRVRYRKDQSDSAASFQC